MTEKRFRCVFKEHETKNSWSMIKDNQLDKPLYIKDVVDLLNELSDENNILNKNEDDLKECTIENIKLKKEIAELQEDINDYHTALFDLHKKYDKLEKENERLKNKLNVTALELVGEAISMGKAVEISEMSYREFIVYRAENGKQMELQL